MRHNKIKQSIYLCMLLLLAVALASGCTATGTANPAPAPGHSEQGGTNAPDNDNAAGQPGEPSEPGEPGPGETAPPATTGKMPHGPVTALRVADDQTGWLGGEGWVARTDDGGASWGTQLEQQGTVAQLFALNSEQVWAAWEHDDSELLTLVSSTDGGQSWGEPQGVPYSSFIHFKTANEAFSANHYTIDGGANWRALPVPDGIVGEAYFHDLNNGWAVTAVEEDAFEIMHTADAGETWTSTMKRVTEAPLNGITISSTGEEDAWVLLIGDSGMTQTSYSLFHTADRGATWLPVLAHSGAGSGPAPGYEGNSSSGIPDNEGTSPGMLYVASPEVAFMGSQCLACDIPNTLGKTTDGGNTWAVLPDKLPGFGKQLLAAVDANHLWWVLNDGTEPAVLYTSADGGESWTEVQKFQP